MKSTTSLTVDDYIASFPAQVQQILHELRVIIKEALPDAKEAIKYQIPTYSLNGNLVSFAAYQTHIGVYPIPAGDKVFQEEISIYRSGKSTARFPLSRPIPFDLIRRLAVFRLQENEARIAAKMK